MSVASSPPSTDDGRPTSDEGRPQPGPASSFAHRLSSMLTLDAVWLAATLTFAFLVGTLLQADQTDYWWTVKLGEVWWAAGHLPTADPLSFTATRQPYVEQQWLAQLVLAATQHL